MPNAISVIRSPILRKESYVLHVFLLFQLSTDSSDVHQSTFLKLFHMTWLQPQRNRCNADFLKVPLNKNEGQITQILSNFASNNNILRAITRDVEEK